MIKKLIREPFTWAWAAANRLVLGQVKVDEKSNEITAIPELLKILEIAGCIVTIDAMGCQKKIVNAIVQKEADYIITVKTNQRGLYQNIEQLFKQAIRSGLAGFQSSYYQTKELAHGREEIRNYLMLSEIKERIDPEKKWEKLKSIGMIESVRIVNGKTTVETRYYISSLPNNAQLLGESVRSHWGIENRLHWVLDVAFNEDDCRIRKENAPQNFAVLRHLAVNFLGKEKQSRLGVKNKQFLASMDNDYLANLLAK